MRTAAPGTGSIADQLNAVAIQLRDIADLPELEYRWPRLVRALEAIAGRAATVRRRGGSTADMLSGLVWLDQISREHPAFQDPGGEPLRAELLRLLNRIRDPGGL